MLHVVYTPTRAGFVEIRIDSRPLMISEARHDA